MKNSVLEPMKVTRVDGRAGKRATFNDVFGKDTNFTDSDSTQANKEFNQIQNYKR